jgi:diacylglycerol kinase (ATP)
MTVPRSNKTLSVPQGRGTTKDDDLGSAERKPSSDTRFDRVALIFNPNSADAAGLARQLKQELGERLPGLAVTLRPTERAGHGEDLARDAARHGRPLIISVSGDGGYNEVVNGLMDAGNPQATCAVKAAGNANDHRRATREGPLVDAVAAGDIARMDLLRLTITGQRTATHTRYAHSYIGVGLTPVVAVDLEKGNKGSLRELVSVVRTFYRFRPFQIQTPDGDRIRIDSLLLANVSQMAKVATLSEDSSPADGRFEVVTIPHKPKWRVLATALKAVTRGLGPQPTARDYRFTALKPMPLQIDGEVLQVNAGDLIRVQIAPAAVATIH